MIKKTINIDGSEVVFGASAGLPRLYRRLYGREIYSDLKALAAALGTDDDGLAGGAMGIIEDLAYAMHKHGDAEAETEDEWLAKYDVLAIYQALPEILDLWARNNMGTAVPKKK